MSGAPVLGAGLELAINRYLALDPATPGRLARLNGRRIDLELVGTGLTLRLGVANHGVQVLSEPQGEPDALLRGTPIAFARLSLAEVPGKELLAGGVTVEGDGGVGQDFGALLGEVDVDWEELVAGLVGDVAAHQLGNVTRDAAAWLRHATGVLRQDLTEYLQEETAALPTRLEVEHLLDEIDTFRSDVDRVAARLRKLEQRLGGERDTPEGRA